MFSCSAAANWLKCKDFSKSAVRGVRQEQALLFDVLLEVGNIEFCG